MLLHLIKTPYIRAVKGIKHINFQKIAAAMFMTLLLSVYAIQAFHNHDTKSIATQISHHDAVTIEKADAGACAICAFEFTRDALVADNDTGIQPLSFFSVFHTRLNASHCFTQPSIFLLRGPPAC
jgi:hypothetical protein